jgi:hypothetical protein
MAIGKRIHLFEFEDQPWFSASLRMLVTDVLQHQLTRFRTYKPIIPKIKQAMQAMDSSQIVDLCSGSGGPLPQIQELLRAEESYKVSIILTDKFPHLDASKKISAVSGNDARYLPHAVDAMAVPADLKGFRTLFSSFHHFRPDDALRILQDAVEKDTGIGIFEFTERSRFMLLKSIFPPIAVLFSAPFIRPFKFSRIFFTYVIPIVPVVFFWDALISNYRTYSPEELKQLISRLPSNNYTWDIGTTVAEKSIWNITYLIGYPSSQQGKRHHGN